MMKICFKINFYFNVILISIIKSNEASDNKMFDIFSSGVGSIFWNHVRHLNFENEPNLNFECASSLQYLFHSLNNGHVWSYKMIDSTSKAPSGLLDFTYTDYGDYDQCLHIKSKEKDILGKYCLASIVPKSVLKQNYKNIFNIAQPYRLNSILNQTIEQTIDQYFDLESNFSLKLGFCIPSHCSEKDLNYLLDLALRQYSWTISETTSCEVYETYSERASQFSLVQKICLYFILAWVGMVLFSTLFNMFSINVGYQIWKHFSILQSNQRLMRPQEITQKFSFLEQARFCLIIFELFIHSAMWPFILRSSTFLHRSMYFFPDMSIFITQPYFNDSLVQFPPYIGGWIFSHTYRKKLTNVTDGMTYIRILVRRWLNMLVSTAMIIAIIIILPILGSGPAFKTMTQQRSNLCTQNGWQNLLFISNWCNPLKMCAPHTWSISSEFQLFALALLNVYLYNRSKKIGLCFNILIIIFGISYLGVISFIKNLPPIWLPKQSFGHQQFILRGQSLHINTFVNFLPYFSPLLSYYLISYGYALNRKNRKVRAVHLLFFFFCIFVSFSPALWNVYDIKTSNIFNAIYTVLCRLCFSILISLFILCSKPRLSQVKTASDFLRFFANLTKKPPADCNNENAIFIKFKENGKVPLFVEQSEKETKNKTVNLSIILARLSKSIFFSHIFVIKFYYYSMRNIKPQNFPNWYSDIIGLVVICILFGYLYFLVFEGPLDSIKKSVTSEIDKVHED